jgi:hypothetical protein
MNAHRYRFRVEALTCDESPDGENALSFEVASHDDVLAIVHRVNAANAFDQNEAMALAVGLKLFTGVMLRHRHDPLFADIQPAMRVFIGNLKARIASSTPTEPSH